MLLPYQKIDLKIYERIKSLGPVGLTVSLADFSQQIGEDQSTTIERLDGLASHKRIGLFKYVGGSRLPSGGFDKNTFFHSDSFIIELTPHGREYFEELERSAEQEARRPLVFISCGQYTEKERQLGRDLAAKVNELTSCKGYFAENQNSLIGLSNDIFRALDQCAAFVAVMHHRGEVETLGGNKHLRGSIWIEQEIGIAAFLTATRNIDIPVVFYVQKGIKREGVREQLKLNPIEFNEESQVLLDFEGRLKSGAFQPGVNPTDKPKRTMAEQYHYETAMKALQELGPDTEAALRHLKTHGTLTFGTYYPPLPAGMRGDQVFGIYNTCVARGLVTQREKPGSGERTFAIAPTMNGVLDELLYGDGKR
jgi:hypothetical protein